MVDLAFYGVACFKIITQEGVTIWIDPYVTQSKCSPIKLSDVDQADIVLVSHSSFDHIGENSDGTFDAFEIVKKTGAVLIGPGDVGAMARNNGIQAEQVRTAGVFMGSIAVKGVKIKGIEAHHTQNLARTRSGYVMGVAQGFLLTVENNIRIYHSGDTCTFPDLRYFGELSRPNIMMLEAGSANRDSAVTTPFEVATAVRWVGPDIFIPIHDPNHYFTDKVAEYVEVAAPHVKVVLMDPGDAIRYRPFQVERIRLGASSKGHSQIEGLR